MNLLVVTTEAFGARGGIARYMRDTLRALSAYAGGTATIHAIPRRLTEGPESVPANLCYHTGGSHGRLGFVQALMAALWQARRFDVVLCGHILLLPPAFALARLCRCPLVLLVYGIDAWQPPSRRLTRALAQRVDAVVAISRFTAARMAQWNPLPNVPVHLVPPTVDLSAFSPGPTNPALLKSHGLVDRKVLLTMARLDAHERYKGVDEVLEAMPALVREFPDLAYVIVGDGDDRPRLTQKAAVLGLQDHVVFAGWVEDSARLDWYRLADAFAMPGRGEGFGIVYLEAMACGVPVVASPLDGSREALLEGRLGLLADPGDPDGLRRALAQALRRPRGVVPPELEASFGSRRFESAWHELLDGLGRRRTARGPTTVGNLL
jgi:glycosyltransferase involved in cell wall biosynthesis